VDDGLALAKPCRGAEARGLASFAVNTLGLMAGFVSTLFQYINTVVPYWRVCDEAWPLGPLGDNQLIGIGVLRNYGGEVMVLPWNQDTRRQLACFRELLEPLLKRIIVVVDDREREDLEAISAILAPITVLPWSRRAELASFIIKDTLD
jgi:hypothetical protein